MIGIDFDKSKSEAVLAALANGTPIEGVRTRDEMLALAGACFFAAMSHGPDLHRGRDFGAMHGEHREATESEFIRELHAAVEFYGQLASLVHDGNYDPAFEPHIRAGVIVRGDDDPQIVPLSGFKGRGEEVGKEQD